MLLIGFVVHFWMTPEEGVSKNDLAAANVARMEAIVSGNGAATSQSKKDASHYVDAIEKTQKEQMRYLTIIVMVLGAGFLGYSFIQKKD